MLGGAFHMLTLLLAFPFTTRLHACIAYDCLSRVHMLACVGTLSTWLCAERPGGCAYAWWSFPYTDTPACFSFHRTSTRLHSVRFLVPRPHTGLCANSLDLALC
ncbi:hypothetical protein RJT34_13208 [Clitoria ternatea]|uniref:Secreted protein n=1 Tax=Clitoria ternatea TaxID=43366 RepID=A0AAN9JNI6_CLITE